MTSTLHHCQSCNTWPRLMNINFQSWFSAVKPRTTISIKYFLHNGRPNTTNHIKQLHNIPYIDCLKRYYNNIYLLSIIMLHWRMCESHRNSICIFPSIICILTCSVIVSDIAIFVLKRDVKLQPTNQLLSKSRRTMLRLCTGPDLLLCLF